MKKIKLFPARNVEIRVHVSDEMERDYADCQRILKHSREIKDCKECSWTGIDIYGTCVCILDDLQKHMQCKN